MVSNSQIMVRVRTLVTEVASSNQIMVIKADFEDRLAALLITIIRRVSNNKVGIVARVSRLVTALGLLLVPLLLSMLWPVLQLVQLEVFWCLKLAKLLSTLLQRLSISEFFRRK